MLIHLAKDWSHVSSFKLYFNSQKQKAGRLTRSGRLSHLYSTRQPESSSKTKNDVDVDIGNGTETRPTKGA